MILCCQGLSVFFGIMLIITAPTEFLGRPINARSRFLIGVLLILQWPVALALSGALLAEVGPGPIDRVPPEVARDRILANLSEYAVLLGVYGLGVVLWWFGKPPQPYEQAIIRAAADAGRHRRRRARRENNSDTSKPESD